MNDQKTVGPWYLAEPGEMPFCKGCGHTHVVRHLDAALRKLRLDPRDVCLVSDIGCIGLVDSLFALPHTVHTTHGRSTAFATGIELADGVLGSSKLKTIVLIGDGGAMIGLLHLVNAALLNVDVTVLLCNNFLFGMTGGQNSAFSPLDFVTPTTPRGNLVPPVDICRMMLDAHSGFVARRLATDHSLTDTIADAVAHPGFALVEIVELCTEYGVKYNELTGAALSGILEKNGQQLGLLSRGVPREEFATEYRRRFPVQETAAQRSEGVLANTCTSALERELSIILAGSAGERVQSAAAALCEAAIMAQLRTTLKTDNPVTQGSGFSFAEIKLSPKEIHYTGIGRPDVVIAVSQQGWREIEGRGVLEVLSDATVVVLDSSLQTPTMSGVVHRLPLRSMCKPTLAAAAALQFYVSTSDILPPGVYHDLLKKKQGSTAELFPREFSDLIEDNRKARSR